MYARDHALIATPIGLVRVEGDDAMLTAIRIGGAGTPAKGSAAAVRSAAEQLAQWFAKERKDFDLALEPTGTPRGDALRAGLIAVGYGETLSYGALAQALGSSPRAIGQLCARNPFPIVVPCHRILAGGGRLGNYSGGDGPKTKSWLLEHERRHPEGTLL
ncbi:methylated-DNA-[protein]-cysteine S-methyltransferase [Sphingomonas naasensis]|uniref:Methylated-DNA--[protein]-cysteine S-methyltransferase n=1 Tax=Sphingomonas naasensis TaxID=1344951 RepID=A0A4S1WB95_9SPHN|nr:methylated-DNA--[protein]-cysteine S-methyltransferase [Sphingomonas naasensis]NIJ21293.1 methylated-DNA-[protein]-cysteine S-methyltransferase [Sphingomonas naasensis]TGX38727.1 methylated-DNA--[protein]-cysteine S-methyltransferase [Sphingomonas naasensis]